MSAVAKPRVRVPAGGVAFPSGLPSRPAPAAQYMRGDQMPILARWRPSLRDASEDVRSAWTLAAARAVDMLQNSGWLAGCAEQSASWVVGTGLQLNAKPIASALGWTQDEANTWSRGVEERFWAWANNPLACDAGGRYTLGQLAAQAYKHWMATGEIFATLPWFSRPGDGGSRTKVTLHPAWRIVDKTEQYNRWFHGVRLDEMGAPIGYRLKVKTLWNEEERDLLAHDSAGRALAVHVFDGAPGQVRGISPFAPILKVMRQYDQLADATLTTALIQTIFAAMFKSPASPEEVRELMQSQAEQNAGGLAATLGAKADWYEKTDLNLGVYGKILHGFPGDELQMFRSEHPNSTYEAFTKFLLRECSRVCAMTYEEFTGDFTGATYSSVRMGNAVVWPRILYRRKHVVGGGLLQPVYEAWLEEDIERGLTPFPGGAAGFLANRTAAACADWRGPTRPQADDLKAAKAWETWKKIGVPDAVIFDELGLDVDDAYEQRKREQDRREALGLKDPAPSPGAARQSAPSDEEDEADAR